MRTMITVRVSGFKERNKGLVQIVNGRYATGGDTTIEAGYGKFNMLKRRDGNRYIHTEYRPTVCRFR